MNKTRQSLDRFKAWFIDDTLPLWVEKGYDHERGGFYESLDFNAEPVTGQPRRARVQARQIYTFSEALVRGWNQDCGPIASVAFDYFLNTACPDEGNRGCVHLLDDHGKTIDDRRDLYDQAFLIMACAARWRAAKDRRALDLAEKTIAFIDRELASPSGGWRESDQGELPRRQNPHMHLFEAFLNLADATSNSVYLNRAAEIADLCFSKFYDSSRAVIVELFTDDLAVMNPGLPVEPGHNLEWVWLLNKYDFAAKKPYAAERRRLYNVAVENGADDRFFGFVNNETNLAEPEKPGAKRFWPQLEYLKASCVEAAAGDNAAKSKIPILIDAMYETYLNTKMAGLWVDEFDSDGAPIAKDVPASILYHLFEAIVECNAYKNSEVST